jgi:hypothetical protein
MVINGGSLGGAPLILFVSPELFSLAMVMPGGGPT